MTPSAGNLVRAAQFLRHVPARQVARRLWLETKRRVLMGTRVAPRPSSSDAYISPEGFEPLPCAKGTGLAVRPDGFTFSFLGQLLSTGRTVPWATREGAARDQLWRMNLHYMEYLRGVEDDLFTELVEQWIAANRPYGRDTWRDAWSAYAVSIRSVIWMEEFARRRARLPAGFADMLRDSLAEQIAFLLANLETDIGGNHLIKNIRALATASRFFAGAYGASFRRRAVKLLARALSEQVLADGMHFERSPSYHNQVLGDLLATAHALGRESPPDLARRLASGLAQMVQVSADLTHPDGQVALFNDAGLNMGPASSELADAHARVVGTPPAPRRHFALAAAGYYGFRDGSLYLVADAGRLGPDALMAHAHGDALSFELSVAGERIVVDQGVYEYVPGPRRAIARSARSHNTVTIEGLEQADFFGAFRCGVRPDVHVTDYAELLAGFRLEACHDGFTRTGKGPVHHRRFELDRGRLEIHDRLDGPIPGPVTAGLLLHPACQADESAGVVSVTRGRVCATISATVPFSISPAVYWPDMGVEEPSLRIVFHWPRGVREATIRMEFSADRAV